MIDAVTNDLSQHEVAKYFLKLFLKKHSWEKMHMTSDIWHLLGNFKKKEKKKRKRFSLKIALLFKFKSFISFLSL